MKKIIVTVIAIIILIIAIFLINDLLNPKRKQFEITTTTQKIESYIGYSLIEEDSYYKKYNIDNPSSFEIELLNNKIKYDNNKLIINNKEVITNIEIKNNFAKYEDLLVIAYKYNKKDYSGVVLYNTNNDTFEIKDKFNDLYADEIVLSKGEINVTYTSIFNNNLIINDNRVDVCKSGLNSNKIIKQNISYYYNVNSNQFDSQEEISKLSLGSYLSINNICK